MGPKPSIRNIFSVEGRLRNQWLRALEETQPQLRLERLREVRQKLRERPLEFVQFWLQFLDDFFDPALISIVTPTDLAAVEEMGLFLSQNPGVPAPFRAQDVWLRVLQVYDLRRDVGAANRLIGIIYTNTSSTWEERTRAVRELAQRGALDGESIRIYADYMLRVPKPTAETTILTHLARQLQVDFDTDIARLKLGKQIALYLLKAKFPVALNGLWTVQGLYALLGQRTYVEAAQCFTSAFEANRNDKLALIGLLTTWILAGAYDRINAFPASIQDPTIVGLVKLAKVIQWLENPSLPGAPPANVAELEQLRGLSKYVGDLVAIALGRIALLTGHAQRAVEVLRPLAGKQSSLPHWYYYLAWAEMLAGKREHMISSLSHVSQWSGRWTIACLVLDADAVLAEKQGVTALLQNAPQTPIQPTYMEAIATRLAITQSAQPPQLSWREGNGSLEEELEALRTMIGSAFYQRDMAFAQRLISHPLFARFPLADKLLWNGMLALYTKDQTYGLSLLTRAASQFGHRRAAIILTTYCLEQNKLAEAQRFLAIAADGRSYGNFGLLQAYIWGREGKLDEAIALLEELSKQGHVKARYTLSTLLLHKAARLSKDGQREKTQQYRVRAAEAINTVLDQAKEGLPPDTKALTQCAQFIAYPQKRAKLQQPLWLQFERLEPSYRQPWLKWNAMLAQVWYGTPTEVLATEAEITIMIDTASSAANSIDDTVVEALAQALANVSRRVEEKEHVHSLVQMLEHFSMHNELLPVKQTCQHGVALALDSLYQKTEPAQRAALRPELTRYAFNDRTNAALGLLVASVNLEQSAQRPALIALRSVQSPDERLRNLCFCFADLLERRSLSSGRMPRAEPNVPVLLKRAYDALSIAVAFASNTPEEGYQRLYKAIQEQDKEIISLINVERLLPALCAYHLKEGGTPSSLIDALHTMAQAMQGRHDGEQMVNLARCAAALGDMEYANQLWDQALSNGNISNLDTQEYVKLLCHLAVVAYQKGNEQEAIRKLRQAAQWQRERIY